MIAISWLACKPVVLTIDPLPSMAIRSEFSRLDAISSAAPLSFRLPRAPTPAEGFDRLDLKEAKALLDEPA